MIGWSCGIVRVVIELSRSGMRLSGIDGAISLVAGLEWCSSAISINSCAYGGRWLGV